MINLAHFGLNNEKVQEYITNTLEMNVEVMTVSISASATYMIVHGKFDGKFDHIEVDVEEVRTYFEEK